MIIEQRQWRRTNSCSRRSTDNYDELRALQARTNPHFLFNSLNTVAGLIEEDPQKAERVLERLSSLFRYSLKGSGTEWVRLAEELTAV